MYQVNKASETFFFFCFLCFLSFAKHWDASIISKMMKFAEAVESFPWKSFCTAGIPLGECGLDNELISKVAVCVLGIHHLFICGISLLFFLQHSSSYRPVSLKFPWKGTYLLKELVCNYMEVIYSKICMGEKNLSLSRNFAIEFWISSSRLCLPSQYRMS